MTTPDDFERALASAEPVVGLHALAQRLLSEGRSSSEVYELFEQERRRLREAGHEAAEDAVMDVMDFLVGWCSPHMDLSGR